MIKTYGQSSEGLVKVFFVISDKGNVSSVKIGNRAVCIERGYQLYVESYVAEQIHKCELHLFGLIPQLKVKDGETLFVPEENKEYEKEKEIQNLRKRLKELNAE